MIYTEKTGGKVYFVTGILNLEQGTKLHFAYDAAVGEKPDFNMVSTFKQALDESAFLTSVPMLDGKALIPDESQKFVFRYGEGEDAFIGFGYVDDIVKQGIRRYWKVRKVGEQRRVIQRVDVRLKVELPLTYLQDSWALNSAGGITPEKGMTMDISNNGLAVCMNRCLEVGENAIFTLPRIGTAEEGQSELEVAGVICWVRELPKGDAFRLVSGIQLRFGGDEERTRMQEYVAYVKKRYRL